MHFSASIAQTGFSKIHPRVKDDVTFLMPLVLPIQKAFYDPKMLLMEQYEGTPKTLLTITTVLKKYFCLAIYRKEISFFHY